MVLVYHLTTTMLHTLWGVSSRCLQDTFYGELLWSIIFLAFSTGQYTLVHYLPSTPVVRP